MKDTLIRYNSGFLSARIGEWLFTVALNWVVFVQTSSPMLLAVINACRLLPTLVVSIPAGKLADRFDRHRLNTITCLANCLLTLLVGLALVAGVPFAVVAGLVVARAVLTAAEAPFRNAYLCSLYSGDRLKSVVAQNASVMNFGRIVGPVLGGALLATAGTLVTFVAATVATAVYAAVLKSLPPLENAPSKPSKVKSDQTILSVLKTHPELKKLLALAVPVMLFGFPFTAMLPLVTENILKLGSEEFGTLLAVSAAGALAASSKLSIRPGDSTWFSTRVYAVLFGLSLLGLAAVNSFTQAAFALFAVGFFGQAYRTSSRMLFQNIVPRERAGKMLGLALMDRGLIPIGVLLVGAIAEYADPRMGVAFMGLGCVISLLGFFPVGKISRLSLASASLSIAVFVFMTGCQANHSTQVEPAGPSVEVAHEWGKTKVPLKPQRVVVLDLPFLDAFTALKQPVVGFAGTSDKAVPAYLLEHLPEGSAPEFVGERKQPNLEVILSLQPDLIIANPDRHKLLRPQLESIAPTIALNDNSVEDVSDMVRMFGEITERQSDTEEVLQRLSASVDETKALQSGQPKVLVVGAFEDEFSTWTEGSFIGSLFTKLGANYAYKGAPGASESQTEVAKITVEGLAELNPDFLFVYGDPERWDGHPIYGDLKAVKSGKALTIDRDLWSRARGPIAALAILKAYEDFLKLKQEVARENV